MRRKAIVERWINLPFYQEISEEFARALSSSGLLVEGKTLTGRQLIEEGFWDSLQSIAGNGMGAVSGFLKKVGLKKEPEDYENAQELFQQVVGKAADRKVADFLEKMEAAVKQKELESGTADKDSKFPYNKTAAFFVDGVIEITVFYESLTKAVEKGEMEAIVANEFIDQLRIAMEKYIKDVEREKGGIYTQLGSGDYSTADIKVGQKKEGPRESVRHLGDFLLDRHNPRRTYRENVTLMNRLIKEAESLAEADAELSDKLKAYKEKIKDPKYAKTLEKYTSLKGPALFAALGIGVASLGFVMQQTWFLNFVKSFFQKTITEPDQMLKVPTGTVEDNVYQNMYNPSEAGAGTTYYNMGPEFKGIKGLKAIADGQNVSGKEYVRVMEECGKVFNKLHPEAAAQMGSESQACPVFSNWETVKKALAGKGTGYIDLAEKAGLHDSTRGTGLWANFSGAMEPNKLVPKFVAGKVKRAVFEWVTQKGFSIVGTSSTGVAVLTGLGIAGPICVAVGVGVAAAAGAVALWRVRAKKKSRLSILTILRQQMIDVIQPPVEVKPETAPDEVEVDIQLKDPDEGGQAPVADALPKGLQIKDKKKGTKKESRISLLDVLFENTSATVKGIDGENVDPSGTVVELPTVDGKKYPPDISKPEDLPIWVEKQLEKSLDGLDFDKAKVTVTDKRTKDSERDEEEVEEEEKPEPIVPPVPVPKPTDNKSFAVAVFTGPKGVQVYRVLKKKTLSRYQSGAKSAGDAKSAGVFKDMVAKYDASINALKAAGLYVNDKKLQTALGNISTGKDGNKVTFDYAKGGKNVKSKTGGFTQMKSAKSADEIRNNILGADGKKVKDVGKLSIVYLVGNNVLQSVAKSAKVDTEKAREIIAQVMKLWAKNKKAPKADKLKTDDTVKAALKKNGLAESFNRDDYSVVTVDTKMFVEVLREIKEQQTIDRMNLLAGIA